jgi:protein-disulfide isomerase
MKLIVVTVFYLSLLVISAPVNQAQTSAPEQTTTAIPDVVVIREDCGCELQSPLPQVLATVNEVKITSNALTQVEKRIAELEQEVVEARKKELDLQINSILLEAEAARLQKAVSDLLNTEVIAKTVEPTEAEANTFYLQNRNRINGAFESVKNDIISYLRDQRQQGLAQAFADRLRAAAKIQTANLPVGAPRTAQDRARVFATVNGKTITSADIEESLRPLIYNVQRQVYDLRKQQIDMRVNDTLLEKEAARKGLTTKALLDSYAKPPVISDADAEKFFTENKERINGDFAQLKPQIIEYLKSQGEQVAQQQLVDRLRAAARIQMFLIEPTAPAYNIAIDDQPLKGNPQATTTVVVFTDFQCPSCARLHPILDRLVTEYGDRARFVIRDYPLSQHENAMLAATAAEAAREQGKYWEYIALLYTNQSALQLDKLKAYAAQLKLDPVRFDRDLASERIKRRVARDLSDAQKVGVNATPTTFVNGRMVENQTYEGLVSALKASLK